MRVVHLSTSDIGHGAGVAAYRLHRALVQANVDSRMLVAEKLSDDPDVTAIDFGSGRLRRGLRTLSNRAESAMTKLGTQNWLGSNELWLRRSRLIADADIVHLHAIHWPNRYIPYRVLTWLSEGRPVVWTLHDMWAVTGHCIYSNDCERWRVGCGSCPDLSSFVPIVRDTTRMTFEAKRRVYAAARFTVVAPSRWLADVARHSPLFTHVGVQHIPYGVDLDTYSPRAKPEARRAFGLDPNARVLATAAHDLRDPRKGAAYLERALLELPPRFDGTTILCIGRGELEPQLRGRFQVVNTGFITHPGVLATAYSAADIVVFPTLADNLPNVVLESMACATPVVSFDVGGVPDMITHLSDGYLAPLRDHGALGRGIAQLLAEPALAARMGSAARERMERHFPFARQAHTYKRLYDHLLNERSGQATRGNG